MRVKQKWSTHRIATDLLRCPGLSIYSQPSTTQNQVEFDMFNVLDVSGVYLSYINKKKFFDFFYRILWSEAKVLELKKTNKPNLCCRRPRSADMGGDGGGGCMTQHVPFMLFLFYLPFLGFLLSFVWCIWFVFFLLFCDIIYLFIHSFIHPFI